MEFRRLERLGPAPVREGKEGFARLKGAGRLRPRERRRLAELYGERERLARARDLPPGRLLPDATLVALARVPWPVAAGRLEEACGLPRRSLRRQRSWVMKALERAADRPPIEERGGEGERPDRTTLAVREKIRGWRRNRARQLGVDSSLLLNRGVMDELARRRPAEPEQLAAMEGLEPWWVERFGGELLALIAAED
jgi:ribonuclease D